MGLLEGSTRKAFTIDVLTIISAFLILIAGMTYSAYLVSQNLKTEGTIFGGVVLLATANSFLNFRKKREADRKKPTT